jgi:hypothetical protein
MPHGLFVPEVKGGSGRFHSFPPPALGECSHGGSLCRGIPVCWRAVFAIFKSERPHPRRSHCRRIDLEDTTDDNAIGKHVIVVIVPFARWATKRRALQEQIVFISWASAYLRMLRRDSGSAVKFARSTSRLRRSSKYRPQHVRLSGEYEICIQKSVSQVIDMEIEHE